MTDGDRGRIDLPPLPGSGREGRREGIREGERPDFVLAVLDCPTCGAPLDAEATDVVFYCTACRNGYRLQRAEGGRTTARLTPVDVAFLSAPDVAADRWVPFWRLPAEVRIEQRATGGRKLQFRDFQLLSKLFPEELPGGDASGSGRLDFVVPAFTTPITNALRLIYEYTWRAPRPGDRIGERLTGGVHSVRDAKKLAHYAFITAEIREPGTLKDLRYDLSFGEPILLGVPAVRDADLWRDALFSVLL